MSHSKSISEITDAMVQWATGQQKEFLIACRELGEIATAAQRVGYPKHAHPYLNTIMTNYRRAKGIVVSPRSKKSPNNSSRLKMALRGLDQILSGDASDATKLSAIRETLRLEGKVTSHGLPVVPVTDPDPELMDNPDGTNMSKILVCVVSKCANCGGNQHVWQLLRGVEGTLLIEVEEKQKEELLALSSGGKFTKSDQPLKPTQPNYKYPDATPDKLAGYRS